MFLIDGTLHWSASDLTAAAECEYALLRTLDHKLGRAEKLDVPGDPLQVHIAGLGDEYEKRLLEAYRARGPVSELGHVEAPYTENRLDAAHDATLKAFTEADDVIFQAAFHDGEFFGYADFIERGEDGWVVCDAKLARSAKPQALLQLGAYADQILAMGLPLATTVSLLLGNGERADFPVADVLPVFRERRARLRAVLAEHRASDAPVVWGDDRYLACGRCGECKAAAAASNDVIGVAGLRMEQRLKLRVAGVRSIADLAGASTKPDGMAGATFDKLRKQAALQWQQLCSGGEPMFELTDTAAQMLALLPAPSPGDLFFDFEGDPMHEEGDLSRVGLEYLWGVMDTSEAYTPTWAHTSAEERAAFIAFVDDLTARLRQYPDLHVYHYAPYETTALKRLAMRYQVREVELDNLLTGEVFVDLYATVRGSVRVSQPSYSIKKLEPLYMGEQLREEGVTDGAGSIVAYQRSRALQGVDWVAAQRLEVDLADYNKYDCLSTLRLRDWLLERAVEAGVRDRIGQRVVQVGADGPVVEDPLFAELMARSGPEQRPARTDEEQAHAMLATSLGYHRRETKQYWWEHFERLAHPIADWSQARDVFVVESVEVVQDWELPAGKKNERRELRLVGDWTSGSKASAQAQVVYATPGPPGCFGPDGAPQTAADAEKVVSDLEDPRVVLLTENRKPGETFDELPVALVPGPPPKAKNIESAIAEVAAMAVAAPRTSGGGLPTGSVFDLLARRAPRSGSGGRTELPQRSNHVESVVEALVSMRDSYLAIQGPPGTGKTYTGSRVVRELVEKHGWRVGVVAQSHAVVENMLGSIVKAGLDPDLVGKDKNSATAPTWTATTKVAQFIESHAATGCVVGGTAWDFANANAVPRGSLDLLVVDEAGQFSLAPTIGASVAAQRLLLLGDPQQLPQVSQGTHAEPVDESALGWLMAGHGTIPADRGYFLGESYRMHPELCAKVSTLSYEGRLRAATPAGQRRLEGADPGLHVVEVPHTGNRTESPEEAAAVVRQVQAHLGLTWHDPDDASTPRALRPDDFLVVAPYNAQVTLIRDALDSAGLGEVRVGTVDKFQGQEAPVALVSMTASSHGDVPRGMGFVLNRNRINVAVSRAQWRAILIRSTMLTDFMPSSAQGLLDLGGFIGLCQPSEVDDWRESQREVRPLAW